VSPNLQKQIIESKDINLASLLMHNYECPQKLSISIKVITKLPNSKQSYKGKVKTHNYINRQNQSTTESLEVQLSGKPDPRLNRSLSISELLKVFGKYKRVMTSEYPDRRAELDAYEDDIIDIYNFFGSKFYDYHKLFSSKAAVLLREKRLKLGMATITRLIG
jgi:hypothetical protein